MKRFGLIGFPLGHSFSQKYFTEKFEKLGIGQSHTYELFPIQHAAEFLELWDRYTDLVGINVTVPHKQEVKQYLHRLDESAQKVGAVNVIKREGEDLVGYNSDMYGFMNTVKDFFDGIQGTKTALILGGGGAAKAVEAGLNDMGVKYQIVSRTAGKADLVYEDLKSNPDMFQQTNMIINTTPLGMHPNVDDKPDIPYELIHSEHYLYDLVYNPEETSFMKLGSVKGATTKNGMEMLFLQADKAWEIWNK